MATSWTAKSQLSYQLGGLQHERQSVIQVSTRRAFVAFNRFQLCPVSTATNN